MPKLFFITGPIASGTRSVAGDLVDTLRAQHSNDKIFTQDLGKDSSVADYGTTPAGAILFEISNMLSYHSEVEVFIFTGWQLLENIQAIYDEYKDTAAFILVKTGNPQASKEYARGKLRNLTTATIAAALEREVADIDLFFTNNNLTPTWQFISTDPQTFNADLTINTTSDSSNQQVVILGTM